MRKRDEESGKNWQRKEGLRDSDDLKGDERHPDQIEDCGSDRNDFGSEPRYPAEDELPFLITVEPALAGQELPPVFLDYLHRASGPARSLGPEGQIVLRQQSPAIAAGSVLGLPSQFHNRQSEIAVFANGVARPAT